MILGRTRVVVVEDDGGGGDRDAVDAVRDGVDVCGDESLVLVVVTSGDSSVDIGANGADGGDVCGYEPGGGGDSSVDIG